MNEITITVAGQRAITTSLDDARLWRLLALLEQDLAPGAPPPIGAPLSAVEAWYIALMLELCARRAGPTDSVYREAARLLGVSVKTLWAKRERYGIEQAYRQPKRRQKSPAGSSPCCSPTCS